MMSVKIIVTKLIKPDLQIKVTVVLRLSLELKIVISWGRLHTRGDKQNITHTGTIALGSTSTSLNSSIQEIRQVSITPAPTSYSAPIELSSSSGSTPSQPTNVANHAPQNSDIDRLIASINNTTTQGYHTIQNSLILRSTLPNHPPILSGQVTTGNIVNPRICSICQVREFDEPFLATRLPCCPKCTLKRSFVKETG